VNPNKNSPLDVAGATFSHESPITRRHIMAGGALAIGALRTNRAREPAEPSAVRRQTWQMPPLALLDRPTWSRSRVVVMAFMWGYLVLAVVLLVVKAAQLAGH